VKEKEIDERIDDVPDPDRFPVETDSRPPEQTESTSKHIFVMRGNRYRCARCGADMNDRTLDEMCPAVR
jgi:rubrerythrin